MIRHVEMAVTYFWMIDICLCVPLSSQVATPSRQSRIFNIRWINMIYMTCMSDSWPFAFPPISPGAEFRPPSLGPTLPACAESFRGKPPKHARTSSECSNTRRCGNDALAAKRGKPWLWSAWNPTIFFASFMFFISQTTKEKLGSRGSRHSSLIWRGYRIPSEFFCEEIGRRRMIWLSWRPKLDGYAAPEWVAFEAMGSLLSGHILGIEWHRHFMTFLGNVCGSFQSAPADNPAGEGFRHRGDLRAQSFTGDGGDLHAEDTLVAVGRFRICQSELATQNALDSESKMEEKVNKRHVPFPFANPAVNHPCVYDGVCPCMPPYHTVRIHVLHTMPAEEKQQLKQSLGIAARWSGGELRFLLNMKEFVHSFNW